MSKITLNPVLISKFTVTPFILFHLSPNSHNKTKNTISFFIFFPPFSSVISHFNSTNTHNSSYHRLHRKKSHRTNTTVPFNHYKVIDVIEFDEMSGDSSSDTEMVVVENKQLTEPSMMEQLVPEIRTHALSYLDYPSLCCLSMTNSVMRKAANDDNAWKALYHKDFTMEQDNMTPPRGWKSYYAATRAVVNFNAEFFRIVRDRSLPEMGQFWLNADYVKCFHASGESYSGYNAVMESWQLAFNWEDVDFQVQDVRTRVLEDMTWVTMKAVDIDTETYIMSNVYEFHNGRWFMVHHHSSATGIGDPLLQ